MSAVLSSRSYTALIGAVAFGCCLSTAACNGQSSSGVDTTRWTPTRNGAGDDADSGANGNASDVEKQNADAAPQSASNDAGGSNPQEGNKSDSPSTGSAAGGVTALDDGATGPSSSPGPGSPGTSADGDPGQGGGAGPGGSIRPTPQPAIADAGSSDPSMPGDDPSQSDRDSGSQPQPSTTPDNPAPSGDVSPVCEAYDTAYARTRAEEKAYAEWQSMQSASEPPTEDPPAQACRDCSLLDQCQAPPDFDADCGDLNACVERHCTCKDCTPQNVPGGSLCECIETCIATTNERCWKPWDDYMQCVSSECADSCGI